MTMSAEDIAKELISTNRFLMISKSWCPDCHYVYQVWDSFGVRDKVHIIELDKMEANEAAQLEEAFTAITGRKWVPTIFFNGKKLGTESELKLWKENGTLENVFREQGIL